MSQILKELRKERELVLDGIPALNWLGGNTSLIDFMNSMDRNEPEWLSEARDQRKRGWGSRRKKLISED